MSLSNTIAHLRKELSPEELLHISEDTLINIAKERILAKHKTLYTDTGFNVFSYLTACNERPCLTSYQYRAATTVKATYKDPVKSKTLRDKFRKIQQHLRGIPVHCVELNETFSCTSEAIEKHPEWNQTKINACCTGSISSHLGLHFYRPSDPSEKIERLKQQWEVTKANRHKSPVNVKPITCIETGITYSSQREAAKKIFNIKDEATAMSVASQIGRTAKGLRKSYKGYHFTYAQDPL